MAKRSESKLRLHDLLIVLHGFDANDLDGADRDRLAWAVGIEILHSPYRLNPGEIRFLRGLLGFSQAQLAQRLGLASGHGSILRWENGNVTMPATTDRLLRIIVSAYAVENLDRRQAHMVGRWHLPASWTPFELEAGAQENKGVNLPMVFQQSSGPFGWVRVEGPRLVSPVAVAAMPG